MITRKSLRTDVLTVKIKAGWRRPYLSTDRNHIQVDTTRLLAEQLGQISKKSDQWSRRRCGKEKKVNGRMYGWIDGCIPAKSNKNALQINHFSVISLFLIYIICRGLLLQVCLSLVDTISSSSCIGIINIYFILIRYSSGGWYIFSCFRKYK